MLQTTSGALVLSVDEQFASNNFGADEDEEHDEDEELRLALEVSLADMHVRDSQ